MVDFISATTTIYKELNAFRSALFRYAITACFLFSFSSLISVFISTISTASFSSHSSRVLAYTFREMRLLRGDRESGELRLTAYLYVLFWFSLVFLSFSCAMKKNMSSAATYPNVPPTMTHTCQGGKVAIESASPGKMQISTITLKMNTKKSIVKAVKILNFLSVFTYPPFYKAVFGVLWGRQAWSSALTTRASSLPSSAICARMAMARACGIGFL